MIGTWDYVSLKAHIGNSDYFTSTYVKRSSRFDHLQVQPSRVAVEEHVLKHISEPFQAVLTF